MNSKLASYIYSVFGKKIYRFEGCDKVQYILVLNINSDVYVNSKLASVFRKKTHRIEGCGKSTRNRH